jgi:ATP-dependent Clp protease protease subunit
MTPSRSDLTRLFPAAALIAVLGLPLTACAQDQVVEEAAEAPAAKEVQVEVEVKETQETEKAEEAEKEEEKTPEEIAKEEAKKELDKLQQEAQLRSARLKAELAPLMEEKQRIEAELALLQTKQQEAHSEANLEKQQADFLASLRMAEMSREMQAMQQQMQAMQTKMQINQLKSQAETAELTAEAAALQAELALLQTKRTAASVDKDEIQYPTQPLKDGVLTISDRRIPLNGGISSGSADYVTERIHYYNNLDEKAPIFIVIDKNPGGSVMEGYAIVTAMKNSKAPIHVVVKQYAASMAAVITTLADHSYTYPNAIILHHQMSSGMRGNLTQQKEQLEEGFEWAKRLADPVAEKMGVTYDEFTELMYKNNSDGDWAEFGDKAKELKWVNHVVEEIREEALVTAPTSRLMPMFFFEGENPEKAAAMPRALTQYELFNSPPQYKVKEDGNGNTFYELPPLSPYDFYFLHNPDGRYRLAK